MRVAHHYGAIAWVAAGKVPTACPLPRRESCASRSRQKFRKGRCWANKIDGPTTWIPPPSFYQPNMCSFFLRLLDEKESRSTSRPPFWQPRRHEEEQGGGLLLPPVAGAAAPPCHMGSPAYVYSRIYGNISIGLFEFGPLKKEKTIASSSERERGEKLACLKLTCHPPFLSPPTIVALVPPLSSLSLLQVLTIFPDSPRHTRDPSTGVPLQHTHPLRRRWRSPDPAPSLLSFGHTDDTEGGVATGLA
jgi:hypothetical protein